MKSLVVIGIALMAIACSSGSGPTSASSDTGREEPEVSVRQIPTDIVSRNCAATGRLVALELARGVSFWEAFPAALDAPELRSVDQGLIAVVYRTGWTGAQFTRFGTQPEKPAPGTWDVCVETSDGSPAIAGQAFIVYGDIPSSDSLALSYLK